MVQSLLACIRLLLLALALTGVFEDGVTALNKQDYDLAIKCFTAIIQVNPKFAGAFGGRGNAYVGKKGGVLRFSHAFVRPSTMLQRNFRDARDFWAMLSSATG